MPVEVAVVTVATVGLIAKSAAVPVVRVAASIDWTKCSVTLLWVVAVAAFAMRFDSAMRWPSTVAVALAEATAMVRVWVR